MNWMLGVLVSVLAICLLGSSSTNALSLKLTPLEYRTVLNDGETKKGYIDISNPTGQTLAISTSVMGFRQVDNEGSLEFFDDDQLQAGVQLDLDSFELKSREAVRMYFVTDGKKLPSGNVFAAIFFTTSDSVESSQPQVVRLGTLLSLQNGTDSDQLATVTEIITPFLQLGTKVKGTYTVKNTGDPEKATGFYPTVTISSQPFGGEITKQSSLVFAGRERENDFQLERQWSPLTFVSVKTPTGVQTKPVIMVYPASAFLALIVLIAAIFFRLRLRNRPINRRRRKRA